MGLTSVLVIALLLLFLQNNTEVLIDNQTRLLLVGALATALGAMTSGNGKEK